MKIEIDSKVNLSKSPSKPSTAASEGKVVVKHKASASPKSSLPYATGRRKTSVARVWIKKGSGKMVINGRDMEDYFPRPSHRQVLAQPFAAASVDSGKYDIVATARGGGASGQAGAMLHGIARAMAIMIPEVRSKLRSGGLLTRDARMVEPKKYGRLKARKKTPFKRR